MNSQRFNSESRHCVFLLYFVFWQYFFFHARQPSVCQTSANCDKWARGLVLIKKASAMSKSHPSCQVDCVCPRRTIHIHQRHLHIDFCISLQLIFYLNSKLFLLLLLFLLNVACLYGQHRNVQRDFLLLYFRLLLHLGAGLERMLYCLFFSSVLGKFPQKLHFSFPPRGWHSLSTGLTVNHADDALFGYIYMCVQE